MVFQAPPLKVGSFSEPPPPQKNFFSSVVPSYLLKVTKFLGKISQFEFLVMTEKNIFAYKLFLSLDISDFNSFLCENCNRSWKKSPPLSQQPPLKVEVLSSPPFLKIWLEAQPPPAERQGDAYYGNIFWDTSLFRKLFRILYQNAFS